jgi:hemerythrin superfamily protein
MTSMQSGTDVVDLLTADHREVEDLIKEIWDTEDPQRRRELADTMTAELVRHSVAEEMYVYPVMREQLPDGEQVVEHDIAEHKEIERTLKDLENADSGDARFTELIRQLESTLRDHVDHEESEQFPKLRAGVAREQLIELGSKVEMAKKIAPTRAHPNAPNNELFHKLVGPGVGLVDRLRDRLRDAMRDRG